MQECPRCGAVYCDAHGDQLCARCEDPALALPSYVVYRGSLLALLVGSVFAVWLLILPSTSADQVGPPSSLAGIVPPSTDEGSGSDAAADVTSTATPTATEPAGPSAGPEPDATSEPTIEPTEEPTPESEPEPIRHVVQSGDTLYAIALRYAPSGVDVLEFQDEIQRFNDIANPQTVVLGQVILVPQR
jgi:LysM repeat protein